MDVLKLEMHYVKSIVLSCFKKPKNLVITISSLGASAFLYATFKLYFKKRRYRHIPGPPTLGYLYAISMNYKILEFK